MRFRVDHHELRHHLHQRIQKSQLTSFQLQFMMELEYKCQSNMGFLVIATNDRRGLCRAYLLYCRIVWIILHHAQYCTLHVLHRHCRSSGKQAEIRLEHEPLHFRAEGLQVEILAEVVLPQFLTKLGILALSAC